MYKTMLVPLDGSKLAEVVFPYARGFAANLDLEIVFLHVSSPSEKDLAPMHWAYVERAAALVAHEARQVRKRNGGTALATRITARGEVVSGDAAEEIIKYAEKNSIDLIMMATHGRTGMTRWILGSVADKALRSAKTPIWLVRAWGPSEAVYDEWPKKTIIVPLDGSKFAEAALSHAEELAKQGGGSSVEVVLINVCHPPELLSMAEYYWTPETYPPTRPLKWEDYVEQQEEKCREAGRQYLAEAGARLQRAGVTARWEVLSGSPAEAIVDYANAAPFSLVVMTTHGRSGITRWAFGSVAGKVLRGVSTPLLLVRPG